MEAVFFVIVASLLFLGDCALDEKEREACLRIANVLRHLHKDTPDLTWNSDLERGAQEWAEHLLQIGSLEHKKGISEGENAYYMQSSRKGKCADAELSWYLEYNQYSYGSASSTNGQAIGHFTQEVWAGTKEVGIGIATKQLANGNFVTYIVGRYYPRGNFYMIGERFIWYSNNVHERIANAHTPDSVYELDRSLCTRDNSMCSIYFEYKYKCTHPYIRSMCVSTCVPICKQNV